MPTKKTTTESGTAKTKKAAASERKKFTATAPAAGPIAEAGADASTGKKRTRKTDSPAEPAPSAAAEPQAAPAQIEPGAGAVALTRIVANVDIGYGNTLYIRGEGGGLNWDKGSAMDHNGTEWQWSTNIAGSQVLTFKLLINDHIWSGGDNLTAAAGETVTATPTF